MLGKCEIYESMRGVISSAGPIDCTQFLGAHEPGRAVPARLRRISGEWKYSVGGILLFAVALFLLVLMADEAMDGGVLAAMLASLGVA